MKPAYSVFFQLCGPILIALTCAGCALTPKATEEVSEARPKTPETADMRTENLNSIHTLQVFEPPKTLDEWEIRREELRRRILIAAGLWPMPEKGPLNALIFERKEHPNYSVEKVLLETYPGYYVTGNLYRPVREDPTLKFPAVLCPHGHWKHGRFENSEVASVPGRAINFARQGYVCFTYDMVAYADNERILKEHRFNGPREALWGILPGAMQLYNGIRAIDFLQSLPDVDRDAIGCTGASGGGTQTFLLYAVDDRVKVAAPVNMISHSMQGGCRCENLPGLRVDSDSMEIGALMAPRPLLMVSATGDWTSTTQEIEYPAIRAVYELHGAGDKIAHQQEDAGHNYNKASREAVYAWFGKWFYPDRPAVDFLERDFKVDSKKDLSVFARRGVPANVGSMQEFFAAERRDRERRVIEHLKRDRADFVNVYGRAYRATLGVTEPREDEIEVEPAAAPTDTTASEKYYLRNARTGQRVPALLWLPEPTDSDQTPAPVLLIHPKGNAGVAGGGGAAGKTLSTYLQAGRPVLSIDCFGIGELAHDDDTIERRDAINFFPSYNLTEPALRIQDILLAQKHLAVRFSAPPTIVGLRGAGPWVLLAHGLAESSGETIADLTGIDFEDDRYFIEEMFIPNIRLVGDFVSSIVLGGDRPVKWTGCSDPQMVRRLQLATETN